MLDRLAGFFFILALVLASVTYGVFASSFGWFPRDLIHSVYKTARVFWINHNREDHGTLVGFTSIAAADAIANRQGLLNNSSLPEAVLVYGGRYQFSELCPDQGCVAVSYAADGSVLHAYPYKPEAILNANSTPHYQYQAVNYDFSRDIRPVGISKYSNGDLLLVFQHTNTFPFSGGAARIDKNGNPRWYRMDYSHHWATLIDNDKALLPKLTVGETSLQIAVGDTTIALDCETDTPLLDTLTIIDANGATLSSVSMPEALLQSPFAAVLQHTFDACDPLHLNYIDIIHGESSDPLINSGDYVVSFRNISAFAIVDGKDKSIKKLVRGTFIQQHSVQHIGGSKFLLFDNQGGNLDAGPSRLLLVDATSGEEQTIFPNNTTPLEFSALFSYRAGKIDISTDKQKVWIAFSDTGRALEIRLSDGEVLRSFSSLHDVSRYPQFGEKSAKAAYFQLYGVDYY